jgi:autotransporter-associated beta strand protein
VGNSLVDADSVQFNVVFSEAVTGVTPADFAAVTNGVTGAAIASVTGSGGDYTVTVSGIEGSGNVGLTLTDGSDILNALGNPLDPTATVPTSGVFTIDRTLYWDPSGGASAAGGTGIWDAGNVWHVGSETGPLQPYCEDSTVIFTGTPGTVTVANNVSVASMTFLTDGYVLQGAQISLASLQTTINVNAGTATIDCGLTGGGLLTTGPGTLVLCGVDSYMLSTTITTGVVTLRNSGALPGGTTLVVSGGVLDLGGYTTAEVPTVTLQGGSIVDGGLQVDNAIDLYSGTVSADLGGTAALDKLGSGIADVSGQNNYQGGSNAAAGTLVAVFGDSLPGTAPTGAGTIIVQPTHDWSGNGDWTTGTWVLPDGTPTPWIDGSNVAIAAGADLQLSGMVDVGAITIASGASINGGTLTMPSWGGTLNLAAGNSIGSMATIDSTLAGSGGIVVTGSGSVVLNGTIALAGPTTVAGGTVDFQTPLAAPPVIAGGQAIGPGAVFNGSNESLFNMDAAMFTLVQSLFAGQTIDRTSMIRILRSADVNGIIAPNALSALETIVTPQNEARLNMPNYVAVLAGDVVNGNPANATYQGQPLGNLADQASGQLMATAINDLIDKWFYGDDLPTIPSSASYSVVAGSLFGNNPNQSLGVPSSADMGQRGVGDCYLIAALGAIADSSPSAIENMFIDNGVENGVQSWTVRFYDNAGQGYAADYVTVNALLPGYSNGSLVFAQAGVNGGYWVALAEKEYAEWNQTGREGRDGQNAYESLAAGWMQVVNEQVLGCASTTYNPSSSSVEQTVIMALQNHEAVTAAIFVNGNAALFNEIGLVSDHAYVVTGYDPTTGTFQLENPWGFYEPEALTWSELVAYGSLTVADTAGVGSNGGGSTGNVSNALGALPNGDGIAGNNVPNRLIDQTILQFLKPDDRASTSSLA